MRLGWEEKKREKLQKMGNGSESSEIDVLPNEPFDKSIQLEKLRKMWKKSDASNYYNFGIF